MVRIEGPQDEQARLDALVHRLAKAHGLHLVETGWARKTYELFRPIPGDARRRKKAVARLESYVLQSGEILVLDEDGLPFAEELGKALEEDLGLTEVVLRRHP